MPAQTAPTAGGPRGGDGRGRGSAAALIEDVGRDLDDSDHPLIDVVVETAQRATTPDPAERTILGFLAVAMAAQRAIDRQLHAPEGIEELLAAAQQQRERHQPDDPRIGPLEELAIYRTIVTSAIDRQLRLDAAMSNYSMWRQKYLDAWCRFPRAIEEFHATLATLDEIEQDLLRWRQATANPDLHGVLDILDNNLAKAFPPVRLMIEKSAFVARTGLRR